MNTFDAINIGRIRHQEMIAEAELAYRFRDATPVPNIFDRTFAALKRAFSRQPTNASRSAHPVTGMAALTK